MKDPIASDEIEWHPNPKNVARMTLDGRTLAWLLETIEELNTLRDKADDVTQLLELLEQQGWLRTTMTWTPANRKPVLFENRYRALTYGPTTELRVTVSAASNGGQTINIQTWWH